MLLKLIILLQFIAIKGNYYDILVNSDASASALQYSLIEKEKVLSELFCLSVCSLNTDCLTVVYHTTDSNCYWFKDQLESSDIVALSNSNLYSKKSSKLTLKETQYLINLL